MIKSLVVVGLLVVIFLCVQPGEAEPGENSAQQKQPNGQSSIQPPSATPQSPINDSKVEKVESPTRKSESDNEQGKPITHAEAIQIGINSFIALVVLGQFLVYNQQRKIMQAQQSLAAISERAYIGIQDVVLKTLESGAHVRVVIGLRNGGKTPRLRL
jgi:hypothetical protein